MRSLRLFSVAAIVSSFAVACGVKTGDPADGVDAAASDGAKRDARRDDGGATNIDASADAATDMAPSDVSTSEVGRVDGGALDVALDLIVRDADATDARDVEAGSPPPDGSTGDTSPLPDGGRDDGGADAGTGADTGPPTSACPASFPDETSGVMLQAFYWEPPAGTTSWWKMLEGKVCDLRKSGITAIWIPPPTKGASSADMGYGVFDRYDLGEYNQKGTMATRWGTRAELESMVAAMHAAGIRVYADVVMNHMMGGASESFNGTTAPTAFDLSERLKVDPSHGYLWDHTRFSG
ncbi:MAG TPA: alpha-amylase family glycosyl hydrolase, partial [Polyangiaceae bacterium]|nr:alpha-amylase family glycosyl hydrolase [Polyangiaceae bacterium]